MADRLLADLVLVLHAAFVAFVVLGGLLVLRWPRLAWLHVPAALWGAGIEIAGGICPLTPLEDHFRGLAGEQGYAQDCIGHYLLGALYPQGLTREVQWLLGGLVVAINLWIYHRAWRQRRGSRA